MNFKIGLLYKMTRSYLTVRLLNKPAPISTLVNITNQCPKICCYCDSWKHPPQHMPTRDVLTILKELDRAGVSRITFHGGDPLMHPEFRIIIREAQQYNFFITLSVRETLVRAHIEDLKYADLVFVSFDGNKTAHDAQKGKGSFDELIAAFATLKENRIPFQTTTVMTKLNLGDIDFIARTAQEFGFYAHFQPLQFPPFRTIDQSALNDPQKNPLAPLMLSKEEYAAAGKKLLELKKNGANIATSKRMIRLLFLEWPEPALTYLPYRLDKSIKCWSGLLYNNIAVTGELIPCAYYNPTHYPGRAPNVLSEGVAQALAGTIKDGSCQTCMIPCYMELNAMFSLDLATIINWVPKIFRSGF